MKKIGRIYGEAKINMREMIGNRENTTEPPAIKRQTKLIEDTRTHLKDSYKKINKQTKTNQLSIEENIAVATSFEDYAALLKTEGEFPTLGDMFAQLGSFQKNIEELRSTMDARLQAQVSNPMKDFVKNEVRFARGAKVRYDKMRVSYDAANNNVKQAKKKQNNGHKILEAEKELEEIKNQFMEVAENTVHEQDDVCDMHYFHTLEMLCDYFQIYEEFFVKGMEFIEQMKPDVEQHRKSIKELKAEFEQKKIQRGDLDHSPPVKMFGVPLEELVQREHPSNGLPLIVDKSIKYLHQYSLHTEAIFRISGSQKDVVDLKKHVERGQAFEFNAETNDHTVSGLLKLFLRELPEPLVPFTLYPSVIECVTTEEYEHTEQIAKLKPIFNSMPDCNRKLLVALLGLCSCISGNSTVNLMTARNLAVVLAPNILYSRNITLENTGDANIAIEFAINHYNELFPDAESWVPHHTSPSHHPPQHAHTISIPAEYHHHNTSAPSTPPHTPPFSSSFLQNGPPPSPSQSSFLSSSSSSTTTAASTNNDTHAPPTTTSATTTTTSAAAATTATATTTTTTSATAAAGAPRASWVTFNPSSQIKRQRATGALLLNDEAVRRGAANDSTDGSNPSSAASNNNSNTNNNNSSNSNNNSPTVEAKSGTISKAPVTRSPNSSSGITSPLSSTSKTRFIASSRSFLRI